MIETILERLAVASERSALALERIAASQGSTPAAAVLSASKPSTLPSSKGTPPALTADKKPAPKPATKAAPKALPAPEPEAEATEGEATEITLAVIGEDISALLQANQKPAAIELLAKFGAKSASGVPEDKYEEFHAEAASLLELAS